MRKTADLLAKIDETLITTYAQRTGQDPEQLREWIKAETWFNAEEALARGFATAIVGDEPENAETEISDRISQWNLSAYARAPAVAINRRTPPTTSNRQPPGRQPENTFDRTALLRRLAAAQL